MYRALSDIAGVGMLTGGRAEIASGPIPRWEALAMFAPRAQERPPPPAHQAMRLLITTDILAEGINLQDAGVVVHLDLPWTSALRDQRVGRCVRLGSAHPVVHVYRLAPDRVVERAVRIEQRVRHKAMLGRRAIGHAANDPFGWAATRVSWLHHALSAWRRDDDALVVPPRMAVQRASLLGALAVVGVDGVHTVLAVRPTAGRWRATAHIGAVLALVRAASSMNEPVAWRGDAPPREAIRAASLAARQAVRRWLRQQRVREEAGDAPTTLSLVQRQALARLAELWGHLSVSARVRLIPTWRAAQTAVLAARSSALELALREWLATPAATDAAGLRTWLERVPRSSRLALPGPAAVAMHAAAKAPNDGLSGLLVLMPD
jgi:hypothetical protein